MLLGLIYFLILHREPPFLFVGITQSRTGLRIYSLERDRGVVPVSQWGRIVRSLWRKWCFGRLQPHVPVKPGIACVPPAFEAGGFSKLTYQSYLLARISLRSRIHIIRKTTNIRNHRMDMIHMDTFFSRIAWMRKLENCIEQRIMKLIAENSPA